MADKDVAKNFKTAALGVIGILVFGVHIALYYTNQFLFNIVVCMYIVTYATIVLISVTKNKDCYTKGIFNVITNFSIYTIILQVFLIIFTVVMMMRKKY